ncbi:MAG: trigger factor [Oscillospiraceae bacterium]|nr:trigger factor [Oscillospiraceae bacterium]
MSLVSTNKIEANKYELEVSADAEQFEAAIEKAYRKAKKNISINGFRKGNAPRKMVEKLYGANVFFEDAANDLIPVVVVPAVEEAQLELVTTPEILVSSINKENGVTFKVTATVKPEVEISDYKGIAVEKTVNAVTDEDVDKAIEALRDRNGRMVTVEDRPAANGDVAVIDFEGFKDGVPFDGGKENDYELNLGSGQFVPGFEEQIVGKSTGDEFTINVTFPENYQMKELAGQPTEFKIKINEIRAKELPELDDEFVKDATDFDTLDELKADYRKRLEANAAREAEVVVDNKLYEALLEKMTVEVPQVMYDNKIDEMVRDFEMRLSQQRLSLEMYLSYVGMDMDAFRKTFAERAEREVKVRLALEKIAKLENIEVSDEKAEEEINKLASQYNMTVAQVKQYISTEAIKADIAVSEAAKLVKDSANING